MVDDDATQLDAPGSRDGLDAPDRDGLLSPFDNARRELRSGADEDGPLPAAPGRSSRWRACAASAARRASSGVSRSAVSQTVRQLEEQLRVVLLARTTRSVSLTDAGRRLVDGARARRSAQVLAALAEVSAQPGEAVGRVRLSVPRDGGALRHRSRCCPPFARVTRGSRSRSSSRTASSTSWRRATTPACGSAKRSSATWCRCGSPTPFASWWWARPATSRATARPSARGPPAPRVHHLPVADHGRALRVGARARAAGTGACRCAAASSPTTAG